MADNVKPRVKVPAKASAGDVVTLKTLISHPMESGQRKDNDGKLVPRMIVNALKATYNGKPVIDIKLEPAVAANPYMSFFLRVEESGTLKFTWTDDLKNSWTAESKIEVA